MVRLALPEPGQEVLRELAAHLFLVDIFLGSSAKYQSRILSILRQSRGILGQTDAASFGELLRQIRDAVETARRHNEELRRIHEIKARMIIDFINRTGRVFIDSEDASLYIESLRNQVPQAMLNTLEQFQDQLFTDRAELRKYNKRFFKPYIKDETMQAMGRKLEKSMQTYQLSVLGFSDRLGLSEINQYIRKVFSLARWISIRTLSFCIITFLVYNGILG